MPGINFVIKDKPLPTATVADSLKDLLHFDNYSAKTILSGPNLEISFVEYDGYPYQVYDNSQYLILVEGMIYNSKSEEIESRLRAIAENHINKGDYKSLIADFIKKSDGEFIILIYFKESTDTLIFNDRWARMPTFYSVQGDGFILSREIKYFLHWLAEIKFDRDWMAEFLIFEYTLGDKCIIKNIKSMKPSQILQLYSTDCGMKIKTVEILPANFDGEDVSLTKEICAKRCAKVFGESLKSRVQRIKENNLNIMVDLSGGHDSRAVFAGLANLDVDFLTCNDHLTEGAEAKIASQVANRYSKSLLNFNAEYPDDTLSELSRITFITDCQNNCSLAFAGFYDELERKKVIRGKHAHFMGLGGEFFRHRYRPIKGYRNLIDMIGDDFFTNQIRTTDACSILGLNRDNFLNNLQQEIMRFPEKDIQGQIKHLNFERYNKFDNGGENRHRLFNWVVSPFWGKELFRFIVRIAPLKYLDYLFFVDFLNALDPKTLEVPIYAGIMGINPVKKMSLFNTKVKLKKFLRTRPFLYKVSKAIMSHYETVRVDDKQKLITKEILRLCGHSDTIRNYFDRDELSRFLMQPLSRLQLYQILTLILYITEIEKRFPEKLVSF